MVSPIARRVATRYLVALGAAPEELLSREFPSDEAFKKYLDEHPRADKSKHRVVKRDDSKKDEKKESEKPGPKSVSKRPDTSKMKVLGEGASRKVFDDGDTVIKEAKNEGGKLEQSKKANKTEVDASGRSDLLAPVLEYAPDYSWVRQEKLTPITSAKLAEHFGVSKADAEKKYTVTIKDPWGGSQKVHNKDWLYAATHETWNGEKLVKSAGKFVEALKELKKNVPKLDLGDFAYAEQWGLGKAGKPLIADYGFFE